MSMANSLKTEKKEAYAFKKIKDSLESQMEQLDLSAEDKLYYYKSLYERLNGLNISYYKKEVLNKIINSLNSKDSSERLKYQVELLNYYYQGSDIIGLSNTLSQISMPKKITNYQEALVTFYDYFLKARTSGEVLSPDQYKQLVDYGLRRDILNRDIEILIQRKEFNESLVLLEKSRFKDTLSKIKLVSLSKLTGEKKSHCQGNVSLKFIKDLCRAKRQSEFAALVERFEGLYPQEFVVRNLLLHLAVGEKR